MATMDAAHLARLRWRCRRGMRELDMLLLRYLDREFASASAESQAAFEALLSVPDPEILDLLAGRIVPQDPDTHALVQRLLAQSRH